MPDFVIPSKLVSEKIEVTFDFMDELDWGETILSWTCTVETLLGEDTAPRNLLAGSPSNAGTTVKQKFYQGIPGCIYNLICDVVGSDGGRYRKVGKLAVLPDGAGNPPLYATFFTTPPYPIELSEALETALSFQDGRLKYQPFPLDAMTGSLLFMAGDVYGGGEAFSSLEQMEASLSFVSGDVYGGGKSFSETPDGMTATLLIYQADLYGAGLAYAMSPEELQCYLAFQSGSLT